MSIETKAFKGASWLALFKFISQIFSWVVTILVARILVPEDYGLMEMATIITGYAMLFSELGLGAAIIQKSGTSQEELSSVFWFVFVFSTFLSLGCFAVAYPTSWIFDEPKVIPITQTVSVLFLLAGLQIVPLNLLKKELQFRKIGLIEMTGVFVSCSGMYIIAYFGGGVWTLIGGHIIRSATKLLLIYENTRWLPLFHLDFSEIKQYLRFGVTVALGESLFYAYSKSDKFFAGRAWNPTLLGYYSFALQLAQIPTEKIVVLINQVSFPAFSKLQFDQDRFNKFYLNIIRITATLVLPIFMGGYLLGENIIKTLLNENWYPMISLFRYLCLAQIMTALNAVNNFVHTAQGRPQWSLYFNAVMAIFMPISFYFAVNYGLNAILIPWVTTYLFICLVWIILTLKKIGVNMNSYLKILFMPFTATMIMSVSIILFGYLQTLFFSHIITVVSLMAEITLGGLVYVSCLWYFDRDIFYSIKKLRKA